VSDHFTNPFSQQKDPDRWEIWELIVRRDSEAFAAQDWGMVEADYDRENFLRAKAYGSGNPHDWRIVSPDVETERKDWLKDAAAFCRLPLKDITPRELIFKMSRLEHIDIKGEWAFCLKQFAANELLTDGNRYVVACESLKIARRVRGRWKLSGAIAYLPASAAAPRETAAQG
jgi:hypothetical protein